MAKLTNEDIKEKQRKKLQALEDKFNVANELVIELTTAVEEIPDYNPPTVIEETVEEDPRIFEIQTLKDDFQLIRKNILRLINNGQRILDTASLIDVSDLDHKQISALSELQNAIGSNLKMMLDSYKVLADIEKLRQKEVKLSKEQPVVNMGQMTTNQILFNGSTSELLDLLKENR